MEELQTGTAQLREIRTVPQIINASVDFFRFHRRSLGRLLLLRAFPFIVVGQILQFFFIPDGEVGALAYITNPGTLLLGILAVFICLGVGYSLLVSLVFSTLKLAEDYGPDEFDAADIWNRAKDGFWKVVGTALGLSVLTVIAFLLYAWMARGLVELPVIGPLLLLSALVFFPVIWSIYLPSRFLEGSGFFEAFRMSQYLVRGTFWRTLGLMLIWGVLFLMFSILSYMLVVGIALDMIDSFWVVQNEGVLTVLIQVLEVLGGLLSFFLSALALLSLGFHYYSQLERKEYHSFEAALESIGASAGVGEPVRETEETGEEKNAGEGEKEEGMEGAAMQSRQWDAAVPFVREENVQDPDGQQN